MSLCELLKLNDDNDDDDDDKHEYTYDNETSQAKYFQGGVPSPFQSQ